VPCAGASRKLVPKYKGPFKVTKVLYNDRYEVVDLRENYKRYKTVVAADKMKPWILLRGLQEFVVFNPDRGHIHFVYAQEMDEIFEKNKSIHPELLLSTDTINEAPLDMEPSEVTISEGSECKIGKEKKDTKKLIMKKKQKRCD
ncbi:unnamed protein product, partial [Acanthoscelides obtectus]